MYRFIPLFLLMVTLLGTNENVFADRESDSLELVKLYNSTDGAMWSITWNLTAPMDTWFGITLDTSGQVISISLPSNNLKGALPNLFLPRCRLLSMSRNMLRDTLPLLGGLPNATFVDLSRNEIDGQLFDFNMPQVENLNLSNNKIQGPIPDFSRMTKMRSLILSDNRLNGGLPDFSHMRFLLNLRIANNFLDGPIPEFNFLPELLTLDLHGNRFVGSVPAFRGSIQLFVVDLGNNNLTGFVPSFSRLPQLETLRLNDNRITGPVANFSALKLLNDLNISNNLLEGPLPDIRPNTLLTDFNASGNNFSGKIPSFSGLNVLQRLDLSKNQLTDTLPDLGYLPNLVELRVDSNRLDHTAFDVSTSTTLRVLEVQNNRFTFSDLFMINGTSLNQFIYSPQKRIPMPDTIYTTIGEDKLIDLIEDFDVGNSTFRWFLDDVMQAATAVNELLLTNINGLDQGVYYAIEKNDGLPFLELYSEEFYLFMDCPYNEVVVIDSICIGDTLFVNNKPYFETGDYRDTVEVPDPTVCDSIFIITLSVFPEYDTTLFDTICESDQVMFGGQIIEESGSYSDTLTTVAGCDSIVHLNLVVWPAFSRARNMDICAGDTLFVGDLIRTTSGLYMDTLQTIHGCDSVIITDLTVIDTFLMVTNVRLCFGETYEFRGNTYSTSGTYVDQMTNGTGCDSTYVLNLYIPESDHYPMALTICAGDSVVVDTNTYKESGIYTDSLLTELGCDSIVVLTLTVTEKFEEEYDLTICRGDTLFFAGDTITSTGIYIDSLVANGGCDSIVKVLLNVLDFVSLRNDVTICFGDSIQVGDNIYKVDGTFLDTLPGERCDTVLQTNIVVNPEITLQGVRTVIGPSGIGFVQPTVSGGTAPYDFRWSTGATTAILDSVPAGNYRLTVTDQSSCSVGFDLELDPATATSDLLSESIKIEMYPNPVRAGMPITLQIDGTSGEDLYFTLFDLHGRILQQRKWNKIDGQQTVELASPDYSGMYTLKIADKEGRFTMRKLLVH